MISDPLGYLRKGKVKVYLAQWVCRASLTSKIVNTAYLYKVSNFALPSFKNLTCHLEVIEGVIWTPHTFFSKR